MGITMPHTLDEAMLLKALQQRMLDEIARKQDGIVNNVYGGGPQGPLSGGAGGIAAAMSGGGSPVSPEDLQYLVDITREDLPLNPETGKPSGWHKIVERKAVPKGKTHPPKKGRSDEK